MIAKRPIWDFFTFNGKNCLDFNVKISAADYGSAERDIETVEVPGRNGDLVLDNGRFKNRSLVYPAYITKDFRESLAAMVNFFLADPGYHRLEDTYNPDVFFMARYAGPFEPDSVSFNEAGAFDLEFDRKPQKWLKSGEAPITVTSAADVNVFNPSPFTALPLIRVTAGTGRIAVGETEIQLTANNGGTIIDCELMDAYEGTTNRNQDLRLTTGGFPELPAGKTQISVGSGMTIELVPRWWRI